MSYIRAAGPLRYVEGNSEDYVFGSDDEKGGNYIEDYGKISDTGFIELLFKNWNTEDIIFKEHLIKRLAKRLKVKIRPKPLTNDEIFKLMEKNMKEYYKE